MIFFKDMKVGKKLAILILAAALSLGAVGSIGLYSLEKAHGNLDVLYAQRLVPVDLLNETRTHVQAINGSVLNLMLTMDRQRNLAEEKSIKDYMDKINQNLAAVEQLPLDAKASGLLAKIKDSQQKYRTARTPVIALALENKNSEAYELYTKNVEPLAIIYMDNLRDLATYYMQLSEKANAEATAAASTASRMMFGFIFAMLCLIIPLGWIITKSITKPLQRMQAFCQTLADGDLRDKPRQITSCDEMGLLADTMANMRTSLRMAFKQVSEAAEQVAAASQELTANAEQSSQALTQVAGSINTVAEGAENQLAAIDSTSDAVQQLSAGIEEASASSNEVADHSAETASKAEHGNAAVTKAIRQMGQIEQAVSTSAKIVSKLGDRSKEIGQIVDTISGIAGQTNLLALNAAIEAARAGEQGRGFAVVAEEVRKLAEQSQSATEQIAALISSIQNETDEAVGAMTNGTQEVQVGIEVVSTASKAFGEIAVLATNVSDQVKEIALSMKHMAGGSEKIVESVQTINEHSKTTVGESQMVSAATEEQSAAMQEVASSSHALATLAQNLQASVSHFRV